MKEARKVLNNTIFLYGKMAITMFSSLYTTRLLLEGLGINDYGLFALIASIISMLMFLNSAMTVSTQRFISFAKGEKNIKDGKEVFVVSILFHILVALIIFMLLEIIRSYLFSNILKIEEHSLDIAQILYQLMIINSILIIVSVPFDALINANEDMHYIAILGILESVLKLIIALFIVQLKNDNLYIYGVLTVVLTLVIMVFKVLYCFRQYQEVEFKFLLFFNKNLFIKVYKFAGFTLLGMSTQMITNYGQGIVINMFFGTVVNAAQSIVGQLSGQLSTFAATMLRALNPMIIKSEASGNRTLMIEATFIGIRLSFYLLILFYLPIMLEMHTVLKYWLVKVPEYTQSFAILLLIKNLIEQLYISLSTSILAVGNIKKFQIYNAIINIFPLPVAYVFFLFGCPVITIYIIFIFYAILQGISYVYFANIVCKMSLYNYFTKVVLKSLLVLCIIVFFDMIPHYLLDDPLERLFGVFVFHLFIFSFTIWFLGFSEVEKKFIIQVVNDFKSKLVVRF